MSRLSFDVIIVGAGPAGLAAAYTCANAGLSTIVIERGDKPGTKNVMGGILYARPTAEVFPDFWKDAPLERSIIEQNLWVLTADSALKLGFRSDRFRGEPPNAYSVLRVKLDRYFADRAEKAGALIVPETMVEEVIREGDRCVGVRTGREEGEVYAPITILAEGVSSEVGRKLGMTRKLRPTDAATLVKEVMSLPGEVINSRFGVQEGEGIAIEFAADVTPGMLGMGWLYTNATSVSIGVGALLADTIGSKLSPHGLLQRMKSHPMIAPLLQGAQTVEYLSHMIPEGGYNAMPPLYGNGVMIAGDAGMMVNAMHREGSNHALISGKLAGETAIEAHQRKDFTAGTLGSYRERLEKSFILPDLRKYRNATKFVESHPSVLGVYPDLAADSIFEMMSVDGETKARKQRMILSWILKRRGLLGLAKDGFDAWRSLA